MKSYSVTMAGVKYNQPYVWKLNKNVVKRDEIIFGKYDEDAYAGGYRRFDDMSLETLKELVALNFIRLDEVQNDAPSTHEILEFMEKYPDYKAIGYVISLERSDYRVTLEGVYKDHEATSSQEKIDFIDLFGYADELEFTGYMRAWFD